MTRIYANNQMMYVIPRVYDSNQLVYFVNKKFVHDKDQNAWWDFMNNWDDDKRFDNLEDAINYINDNLPEFYVDEENIAVYEDNYIIPLIPCDEGDRTDDNVEYCSLNITVALSKIKNNFVISE